VADHVTCPDGETLLQPAREPQRRGELAPVAHDVAVADPDVLDAHGGPVQADHVSAHQAQRDELVDAPVARDDEVRADARALVQLHVRRVRGERVEGRPEALAAGEVLDDHLGIHEAVRVDAVVATGVAAHLALALYAEGDRVRDHGRPPRLVLRLRGVLRCRRQRRPGAEECEDRHGALAPLRTGPRPLRLARWVAKWRFLV
jgi:hypothetical protein